MSKNNCDSDLIILILTGKITLSTFKKKVNPQTVQILHDMSGKSIVHHVSSSSNYEFATDAIQWLYDKHDLDLSHSDENGNNVLFYAAELGNLELIEYLAVNGLDFNLVNSEKESALFSVYHTFDKDTAEALLRNGISVDIENIENETIIDVLEKDGEPEEYEDILEMLNFYKFENSTDNTVKVYSSNKLKKGLRDNTDGESARIPLYNNMLNSGDYRALAKVSISTFNKVDELSEKFPHFKEIINYIKEQISLSLLSSEPYFSLKPLLMVGGPGVGKTRFNMELSEILETEIVVIDGGNVSAGFIIGGSSPTWRDSSPGKVAKQLINGKFANPIVQLDEIDKMTAQQGFDPFGPLHPLLESKTSESFNDEFVGIPMDCSYVNWIATANSLITIPAPILSRFLVVNIPSPSESQMVKIVKSVYNDIINDPKNPWGEIFYEDLHEDIIRFLVSKTPREINRVLLSAMGKVALREVLSDNRVEDTLISIKPDDVSSVQIGKKRKIGMV